MKAINYKMKKLSERPEIIQNKSFVYKKTSNVTKIKINWPFLWKTRVEASKVITNSIKTLDFVTSIPFDTFPWQK